MLTKPFDNCFARSARVLFAGVLLAVSLPAADTAAEVSERDARAAEAVVASLHRGLIDMSASEPNASVEQRVDRLQPLISETHDLPYVAELTIRRQWRDLTVAERERFVAAFERLSVRTYASRFATVDENVFTIVGSGDAGSARIEVNTTIARREGGDVTLDYTLHNRDGAWRIVNILADGVSDLALKRAEYRRILAGGTIDDLVDYLTRQGDDLQ